MNLEAVIEGILFLKGNEGISVDELKELLNFDEKTLVEPLDKLKKMYDEPNRGIKIDYLGGKLKLTTKKEHKEYYERLTEEEISSTLSPAALEALVIIAYNQPITRIKVDEIRGVSSQHLVRKLLLKGLIKEMGKSDQPGRPNLYKTTDFFLDYFNLSNINELPKVDEEVEVLEDDDLYKSKYKEEDF